ncbi:MAG: CHAT domain-containing protein, partial [Planctomycetes bacterium]|nr:CHAT domain-containing protein [Planctomycetota bacterium]
RPALPGRRRQRPRRRHHRRARSGRHPSRPEPPLVLALQRAEAHAVLAQVPGRRAAIARRRGERPAGLLGLDVADPQRRRLRELRAERALPAGPDDRLRPHPPFPQPTPRLPLTSAVAVPSSSCLRDSRLAAVPLPCPGTARSQRACRRCTSHSSLRTAVLRLPAGPSPSSVGYRLAFADFCSSRALRSVIALAEYTLSTFQRDPEHVQVRFAAGTAPPSVHELSSAAVSAFAASVEAKLQLIGNHGNWLQPQLDLGRALYRWLREVTEGRIDAAVASPGTLTLRLDLLPELQVLPWELLARDTLLADHATRPFSPVRVCNATHEWPEQANRPLRVLFMACSPVDLPEDRVLRFEEEESLILDAAKGRSIELEVEESGTLDGLKQRLADFGDGHFDVAHLTGHANIVDGNPYFAAEDDFGQAKPAFADDFGEAFGTIWPRVVVVSGCKTGQAGAGGAFPSLSEKLVESGAAAVVGWSASVADATGNVCAQHLYRELCAARPLCESVAEARRELLNANRSDWHLLRLYAGRGQLGALVTPANTTGRARVHLRP